MARKKVDEEDRINGGWFETDKAVKYDETKHWNGSNHISNATGSQWDHEALYRTATGAWIIDGWSQYQGRNDWCRRVPAVEAHAWLVRCGHEIPECLAEIDAAAEL
jgi:hypothetical protein